MAATRRQLDDALAAQLRDYSHEGDLRRELAGHKKGSPEANRCQRLIDATVARMRDRDRDISRMERELGV